MFDRVNVYANIHVHVGNGTVEGTEATAELIRNLVDSLEALEADVEEAEE